MASITYDGQSFLLDGRRVWLVSGTIHPARVPRAQWADRIHAAKQAGLNCIEMPVVWSRHEPRHNQFDFTGENDIREFARLIHQAGLWCILRAGPFIDGGYDMGGLPPWLLTIDNLKLRTANQPFLEACSRYITALAGQLRDMQVSSPVPKGSTAPAHPGPIIMLRTEGGFTCGDDQLAHTYLGELDRYWREAGFNVPLINSNDLWQSVEGEIDGWSGYDALLSHLRQLGAIRPAQPRIVIDFQLGSRDIFGEPAAEPKAPGAVLRRLAEVLAAGGQFNISPFHGGTNFGFSAGRDITQGPAGFPTASADAGAPVSEQGETTAQFPAVRRICTFASRFSRVLSHLDPARQPVALLPESLPAKAGETSSRVSVIHAVGSQGGVVFVFGDDAGANNPAPMSLLLPDGSTLPVDLGDQSVVWCLLETRLSGRANLDYCNLCAMALVGKVFVCFGAPGARAALSINGSPLETTVPEGKSPLIQEHEGITVVIASMAQIDRIFFDDNAVYIGVLGLDAHGKPITDEETRSFTLIDSEGKASTQKVGH
ncbi:MAG TPA: beta-galactosidase, partial [Phycisphaerales bacterium]|nr:beta-galactosidase [Phycisphaerales bacterium]